jgi:hypothetical protein
MVWSISPDGSSDFLNKRFRDYTGLSLEDICFAHHRPGQIGRAVFTGTSIPHRTPPEERARIIEERSRMIERGGSLRDASAERVGDNIEPADPECRQQITKRIGIIAAGRRLSAQIVAQEIAGGVPRDQSKAIGKAR